MQQVAEIKQRAHVCPACKGNGYKVIRMGDLGQPKVPCLECNHTGQVEAPDTDQLCHAIQGLVKAVKLTRQADDAMALCAGCQYGGPCPTHRQLYEDAEAAESAALSLIEGNKEV